MQVRATGFTAVTHQSDVLSNAYLLPFFYKIFQIMSVNRDQTAVVLDDNEVAITAMLIRIQDFPGAGRMNFLTPCCSDINAIMWSTMLLAKPRRNNALKWPTKRILYLFTDSSFCRSFVICAGPCVSKSRRRW